MDRAPTFALMIVRFDGWYQNQAWHGAATAARLLGVRLVALVASAFGDPEARGGPTELYRLAGCEDFDGYLPMVGALGNFDGPGIVRALMHSLPPRPTVCLGVGLPDFAAVVPSGGGIDTIVRHLHEVHGARRIAYVGGPANNPDAVRRRDDYQRALAECGIAPDPFLVEEGDFSPGGGRRAVAQILSRCASEQPRAIICANDAMAIGVRQELKSRGIAVPDDMLLTGYDDIEEARTLAPPLTTVNAETWQMSFRAVEMLAEMHRGGRTAAVETVPTKLVVRRSCGCRSFGGIKDAPHALAGAAGIPGTPRLHEMLGDGDQAERFLVRLESALDMAEEVEIDMWDERLLELSLLDDGHNASRFLLNAHWLVSRARHSLDLNRRLSLQYLMRDQYAGIQALMSDLSPEGFPCRIVEALRPFANHQLRLLLFNPDLSPIDHAGYGIAPFRLEIDAASGRVGPPPQDTILPAQDGGRGSWAVLPVCLGDEHFGVVQVRDWVSNEVFLESLRQSLAMVLSAARKAVWETEAREELRRLSHRDELTGALNRRGLLERGEILVQSALRSGARIGVVLCDLDGLKEINDRWGHADGDLAIRSLARALQDSFRQSDVVARLGGDEFAVISLIDPKGSLDGAVERIRVSLAHRSTELGRPWTARTSAGWLAWDPGDGHTLESALALADSCLYHDKRERRKDSGQRS